MSNATRAAGVLLLAALIPAGTQAAKDRAPGFLEQSLDLPGMPAAVIPADMNRDGRDDLVVLVAYTSWGDVATTEQVEFDDIEGLVEVMSVVSALIDRRELRVYPARPDGSGFGPNLPPLDLDTSVHALSAVPPVDGASPTYPLLAITDEGVAAVHLEGGPDSARLVLEPLLEVETSLAGTGAFYSEFDFVEDLDGDGWADLLLPSPMPDDTRERDAEVASEEAVGDESTEGAASSLAWSVHRAHAGGFAADPTTILEVPPRSRNYWEDDDWEDEEEDGRDREARDNRGTEDNRKARNNRKTGDEAAREDENETEREVRVEADAEPEKPRRPRQPRVLDVNGDGRPDLVVFKADRGRDPLVYLNRGDLRFDQAVEVSLARSRRDEEIVFIGDLAGDRQASVVAAEELEPGDEAGFKKEIEHAKEPDFHYRVHPLGHDLSVADEPTHEFGAEGYIFEGDDDPDEEDVEIKLPGGFQDLDGDGRQDLVAITLDFSIIPLIFRALVLGSISMQMDFHPYCQLEDGSFARVEGLDLSGKFKINIRNVQVKHLSQFEGDFNGDGRADFVQLGRGKKVSIHQGGPGCTYPIEPDRKIRLAKEPRHLGLVRILDLDADGRSDIYVVHPQKAPKSGETAPVRLDIYLGEAEDATN